MISAPQEKEAGDVIRQRCKETGSRLYEVQKDILIQKLHQGFSVIGISKEYPNLELRLTGRHQLMNAAVAIGAVEALQKLNVFIDANSVRSGLYNVVWPGRCEVISTDPLIVLDGAQNSASASVLKEAVKENFRYQRLILVLGISQDKDIQGVCRQFYDLADEVILTMADNPRATAPVALARYFDGKTLHLTRDVTEAKKISKTLAGKHDLVLVTGSLFVVGEFRNGPA